MPRTRTLLFLAVICLLALSVVADDDKFNRGKDGGSDGRGRRQIVKKVLPHTLFIRGDKFSADQNSRLSLLFTTNGFPRLRLFRYKANETDDSKASFTFRIGLRRLVEFIDQGTNCLDVNDTVTSQFSLIGHSGQWTNIQETVTQTVLSDNTTANTYTYCTSLSRHSTTFNLCLRIADRRITDAKGHTFGPSRVKLDIEISNYQFVNASGVSKLALVALISSISRATNNTDVPRTVFFNSDGAVDWQGSLDVPLGWPVVATAVRDLSDLDRREHDDDGNDGDDDDDTFKVNEITKAIGFCVDNSTHTNQYTWDPAAEINELNGGSVTSGASATSFAVFSLLLVLLSLLSFN